MCDSDATLSESSGSSKRSKCSKLSKLSKRPKLSQCQLVWRATGSKNRYEINLTRPEEGDECAISCDNIRDAKLDWMPEGMDAFTPYDSSLKKATLPCKHSFAVAPLAYHFIKNQMRCPVCRNGEDNRLNYLCIPKHMRLRMVQHAEAAKSTEEAEEDEANRTATMLEIHRIIMSDRAVDLEMPFTRGNFPDVVTLHVGIYTSRSEHDVNFILSLSMRHSLDSPGTYSLQRNHLRDLTRYLRNCSATGFTMQMAWEGIELCCTPRISLPFASVDAETGAAQWRDENRRLFQELSPSMMQMSTICPETGGRQLGFAAFRHWTNLHPREDCFLPFDSMYWCPVWADIRDAIAFATNMVDED